MDSNKEKMTLEKILETKSSSPSKRNIKNSIRNNKRDIKQG